MIGFLGRLIGVVALSPICSCFPGRPDRKYFDDIGPTGNIVLSRGPWCLRKGLRGPCPKGGHVKGTRHQGAQHGPAGPTQHRYRRSLRNHPDSMAARRALGVLGGGFGGGPRPMAVYVDPRTGIRLRVSRRGQTLQIGQTFAAKRYGFGHIPSSYKLRPFV